MEKSDVISAFALLVSLISLAMSFYFEYRDRAKLQTKSYKLNTPKPSFRVKAVNAGRRVITLDGFGVKYSNGNYWMRRFEAYEMHMENNHKIEKQEHGRRLDEHDYFEETISADHDFYNSPFSDGSKPVSILFQDTTGKEYVVKDSKKNLALINKYLEDLDAKKIERKKAKTKPNK